MILLRQKIGRNRARVCNAQCYNAKTKYCDCICSGKNHGQGEAQARENVREIFLPLIEQQGAKTMEAVRHQESLPFGDDAA